MNKNRSIRSLLILALVPAFFLLGGCAVPEWPAQGAARQGVDQDDQEYVTGSRLPVRDKTQTGVQTSTDIQSSGVRGN